MTPTSLESPVILQLNDLWHLVKQEISPQGPTPAQRARGIALNNSIEAGADRKTYRLRDTAVPRRILGLGITDEHYKWVPRKQWGENAMLADGLDLELGRGGVMDLGRRGNEAEEKELVLRKQDENEHEEVAAAQKGKGKNKRPAPSRLQPVRKAKMPRLASLQTPPTQQPTPNPPSPPSSYNVTKNITASLSPPTTIIDPKGETYIHIHGDSHTININGGSGHFNLTDYGDRYEDRGRGRRRDQWDASDTRCSMREEAREKKEESREKREYAPPIVNSGSGILVVGDRKKVGTGMMQALYRREEALQRRRSRSPAYSPRARSDVRGRRYPHARGYDDDDDDRNGYDERDRGYAFARGCDDDHDDGYEYQDRDLVAGVAYGGLRYQDEENECGDEDI